MVAMPIGINRMSLSPIWQATDPVGWARHKKKEKISYSAGRLNTGSMLCAS